MRILNLGSLNLDHVYDVNHFVSPGETILANRYEAFWGGKGLNQSIAASRAGAEVFHAGAIGTDGTPLRKALQASGVDTEFVRQVDEVSGHAMIQSNQGQNCIIVYGGANRSITEHQIDEAISRFNANDLLLLQNEISCVPYAIQQAKKNGLRIAFNASPITSDILSYPLQSVDYFLVNEIEGRALCKGNYSEDEQLLAALTETYPNAVVILTVGSKGVYLGRRHVQLHHGTYDVKVVDTTAAGDTFCGYFMAGIAKNMNEAAALEYASLASSLAVSKKGAANSIPTMEEVEEFHMRVERERQNHKS